ncbi:MAG: hypothetical protein RR505_10705, partial [Raoultibacter sp.]
FKISCPLGVRVRVPLSAPKFGSLAVGNACKASFLPLTEHLITEQGKAIVKKDLCRLKGIVRIADSIIKTEVLN